MKIDGNPSAPGGRCTDSISPIQAKEAEQLADDVKEFVRRGGKIQKLRNGELGQKWLRGHEFHRKKTRAKK